MIEVLRNRFKFIILQQLHITMQLQYNIQYAGIYLRRI